MSRRSGLGRGLAALIPPTPKDDAAADGAVHQRSDLPEDDDAVTVLPPPSDGGTNVRSSPAPEGEVSTGAALRPEADDAEGSAEDEPSVVPTDAAPAVGQSPASPGDRAVPTSDVGAAAAHGGIDARTATLAEVAPDRIEPNPDQPRDVFDPDELEGLAISLRDIGVLQPLVVRPVQDGRYQLIAGERRWRAAQLAGLATVPVVVRHTDDASLLKEALVENIHRVQLNPLEEAAAYQQLLEDFEVTQEELAERLGRSRPSISNAIRLLQLPSAVQRRLAAGVLSAGHAKVLLAVDDAAAQTRLADRIVAEGLSVRATEELVRLQLLDGPSSSSRRRRGPTAPGLVELQDDLSDALEARVRITMGARKGKVAIEFASVDDLERIVGIIAGGISASGRASGGTAAGSA
ncbi:MAG: ParB/RepB/Spo0J family partition protein [Nitriliruptoraceae bacterium]|nr:ParB/RepB/Spo0J family partition protein [Nitriliruptoraceae bacterium]